MMFKRVFTIVIDSVGAGEMPDAAAFGDVGANTLANIAKATGGLNMPVMEKLGLGSIIDIEGIEKVEPTAVVGKMAELSNGKDTMTGHWEMMGIQTTKPFITFTDTGFPKELIDELEQRTGRKVVGNKAASGTEIIKELGEHHVATGDLIVYTSADSVLQICAHEEVIPLEELYEICHIAREITLRDEWRLGRIIARPFIGTNKDDFTRTPNRHDYALEPTERTTLNELKDAGFDVISIGKISDIFNASGITEGNSIKSNHHGMETLVDVMDKDYKGFCFVNLVDFDALYGHRRNPEGYKGALEEFDTDLQSVLDKLQDDDLLVVLADHGNDPTMPGTDHTREYVPLVVYANNIQGKELEVRESFADLGATIAENFDVKLPRIGTSFLGELK